MNRVSHEQPAVFQPVHPHLGCTGDGLELSEREVAERAILRTLLYADVFDYPLTADELVHYLEESRCSPDYVLSSLSMPGWLKDKITQFDGFITLRGREGLVLLRRARRLSSARLWRKARIYCRLLSILPFVRMVAVTGALAMDNSDDHDDIDVMIVTEPNRVWIARAFSILVVRASRLAASNTLCPNYVLSHESLCLEPRSIYVAHEFAQMVPLFGLEVYRKMRATNRWIAGVLPNADCPLHQEPEYRPGLISRSLKRAAEFLLSGELGDRLETWEMRRKIRKLSHGHAVAGASVVLDRTQVKGHFADHGARIASKYQGRLQEHEIQ